MTNTDTIENVMTRLGKVFLSSRHVITLEEFLSDEVLRNDIQAFLRDGWLSDEIFDYMKYYEDVVGYIENENVVYRMHKAIEAKVSARLKSIQQPFS